jgi:hypothetical protein
MHINVSEHKRLQAALLRREQVRYIASRCFESCSHNQECISVECQVLDVPFDARKQPICRMIDTLNLTNIVLMQFFAHSNVTQMGFGNMVDCCLVMCVRM